jgi:predicted nucleotidyltransferase
MGRIFTWEEISQRRVPVSPQKDFLEAIAYIREQLEKTDGVLGALFFGSAVRHDFTMRSDVDCLVVIEDGLESQGVLSRIVQYVHSTWYIEVSFEIVTEYAASAGCHTIGPLFWYYLSKVDRGQVVKSDPLILVKSNEGRWSAYYEGARSEYRSYLRFQVARLSKGLFLYDALNDAEKYRFLRKVLESPIAIARKRLQYERYGLFSSGKEVPVSYRGAFGDELADMLQELIEFDEDYTNEVMRQMQNGGPIEGWYGAALRKLYQMAAPLALRFAQANWEAVRDN